MTASLEPAQKVASGLYQHPSDFSCTRSGILLTPSGGCSAAVGERLSVSPLWSGEVSTIFVVCLDVALALACSLRLLLAITVVTMLIGARPGMES